MLPPSFCCLAVELLTNFFSLHPLELIILLVDYLVVEQDFGVVGRVDSLVDFHRDMEGNNEEVDKGNSRKEGIGNSAVA